MKKICVIISLMFSLIFMNVQAGYADTVSTGNGSATIEILDKGYQVYWRIKPHNPAYKIEASIELTYRNNRKTYHNIIKEKSREMSGVITPKGRVKKLLLWEE